MKTLSRKKTLAAALGLAPALMAGLLLFGDKNSPALHADRSVSSDRSSASHVKDVPFKPAILLSSKGTLPDQPEIDVEFVAVAEETFNGVERTVHDVAIVGVDVVFDPWAASDKINSLDSAEDIKRLTVTADRLIVRGTWHLPGTEVKIYARQLIFDDVDVENPARIVTTPLDYAVSAEGTGNPGAHGQNGGDIWLHIGELYAEPAEGMPAVQRFVLTGGIGQAGGAGEDGADGQKLKCPTSKRKVGGFLGIGQKEVTRELRHRGLPVLSVTMQYPQRNVSRINGKQNTPAGKPGNGGEGGSLYSTLPIADSLCDLSGGKAGPKGAETTGGKPGAPKKWYDHDFFEMSYQLRIALPGRTIPAPEADKPVGEVGSFEMLDPQVDGGWFKPRQLRMGLDWIRDLYLAGHYERVRDAVVNYLDAGDQGHEDDQAEMALLLPELTAIAQRRLEGLDYFGNPEGWVPMLSFETNYAAFEAEVERSIKFLYVTYWLERYWNDKAARLQTAGWVVEQLAQDREADRKAFRNAHALLPSLRAELAEIELDTERFMQELRDAEEKVEKEYAHKQEVKRNIRALLAGMDSALQLWTFSKMGEGKKGVGKAAATAGAFSAVGSYFMDEPPAIPNKKAADLFRRMLDEDEMEKAREQFGQLDPSTATSPEDYKKELNRLSGILSINTRNMVQEMMESQITSEAGADLHQLKTDSPEVKELMNRLVEVMTRRQLFHQKVSEATAAMQNAVARIAANSNSMDHLRRAASQDAIDAPTLHSIHDMRRQAKERLIRYQYVLVKSYEYRTLERFNGTYQSNRLFDKLAKIFLAADHPDALSKELKSLYGDGAADVTAGLPPLGTETEILEALRAVYMQGIDDIVSSTLHRLNDERFSSFESRARVALTEDEIAQLNETGEVRIDLESRAVYEGDLYSRLANVELLVDETKLVVDGVSDSSAQHNVRLTFAPAGRSVIHADEAAYAFSYGQRATTSLVQWGHSFWCTASGEFAGQAIGLTDDDKSMVAALIRRVSETKDDSAHIRFRPGARTELIISKDVKTNAAGSDVRVTDLALLVTIQSNTPRQSASHQALKGRNKSALPEF